MIENTNKEEAENQEELEELEAISDESDDGEQKENQEAVQTVFKADSHIEPAKNPSKKIKSRRLPPLLRLSRRATVFLSLLLIASGLFFITGNKQTFLDSNLKLILNFIACDSIALTFFSACSSLECIYYLAKEKKFKYLFHLPVYMLILATGTVISIVSLTINLLSEGIDF